MRGAVLAWVKGGGLKVGLGSQRWYDVGSAEAGPDRMTWWGLVSAGEGANRVRGSDEVPSW